MPGAAIPGGDVAIHGSGFEARNHTRPRVRFGEVEGSLLVSRSEERRVGKECRL